MQTSPKAVLITGCSSGIGLAAAYELRRQGYDVLATARKSADVAKLQKEGFHAERLDLDDSASIQGGFDWAISRNPNFYGLFNNAGWGLPARLEDVPRAAMRAIFESNVFGAQELTNLAVRYMREHNIAGRIIYNSSVLGYVTIKHRAAYCASKHALEALADSLRQELASTAIKVILLEPGPITSEFRNNAYRAYKKWIRPEASLDLGLYRKMEKRFLSSDKQDPFNLEPDAVNRALVKALSLPNPSPRYRITVPSIALWYLRRLLPTRWLDRVTGRIGE